MQSVSRHRHQSTSDPNHAKSVREGAVRRVPERPASDVAVGVCGEEDFAAAPGATEEDSLLNRDNSSRT